MGRPRLPLSDVVFAATYKTYSTMSGRRAMSALSETLGKAPSFQSSARYLENPALTPILKAMIEESASPLKAVECDFAVDSSGFATSVYSRWYDAKYGKVTFGTKKEAKAEAPKETKPEAAAAPQQKN